MPQVLDIHVNGGALVAPEFLGEIVVFGRLVQVSSIPVDFAANQTEQILILETYSPALSGESVKVEIKPLAVPRFTSTITTYSNETWLLEAGQWWYFENL